jgi:hypothetical protein
MLETYQPVSHPAFKTSIWAKERVEECDLVTQTNDTVKRNGCLEIK